MFSSSGSLPTFLLALQLFHAPVYSAPNNAQHDFEAFSGETIIRDVCVIGGGSSGTYAAIRLQEMGHSVVVVEQKDVLGGHTNTFHDSATNSTIDYGVSIFHNIDIVKEYFAKFDIPVAVVFPGGGKSLPIDFRTGKVVDTYVDPASNATAFQLAFGSYAAQLSKYPYLLEGFDLPNPIPEDLLIPFGDFIRKYSLEAVAFTIANNAQGFGDFLSQPTLYVLKYFSVRFLEDIQIGFITTANGNNGALYEAARQRLGSNVLLKSHVVAMDRKTSGDGYVRLIVSGPTGKKLIQTKRLLVTIPPKVSNMHGFDLTPNEKAIFGQFRNSGYYTGIIRHTGLPENLQFNNIATDTPYNLPALPGIYNVIPTRISGLYTMTYGTLNGELPAGRVKEAVVADIKRLARQNPGNGTSKPDFIAFESHSPYELTVSADAIKAGYYSKLYALQGQGNTWYSGAAFQMHDSGLLWNFTEHLLPRVVAGL
jgi:hypothetical protein